LLARAVPGLLKEIQPYVVASHLSKKDPEQALKIAQQTIARLPEDENVINSYLLEASVYQDRKNYAEATAAVMQALRINPRFPEAHNSLGNVLYLQHKLDEAMLETAEPSNSIRRWRCLTPISATSSTTTINMKRLLPSIARQ
jgi:tetratricopeptide (TPR) repeat protein